MIWKHSPSERNPNIAADETGNQVEFDMTQYPLRTHCRLDGKEYLIFPEMLSGEESLQLSGTSMGLLEGSNESEITLPREGRIRICQIALDGLLAMGLKCFAAVEGPTKFHLTWLHSHK